jgi:hypothetical protein
VNRSEIAGVLLLYAFGEKETPMMLSWKIRYLDKTDKRFKDRYLELNTESLEPAVRAAVELVVESTSSGTERAILKFRRFFVERTLEEASVTSKAADSFNTFCVSDYFEDETGRELGRNEMAQIMTGSPIAIAIPPGAQQHDIDRMLAETGPIPLAEASLSAEEVRLLGYFVRDLKEMLNSAFLKDSPVQLTWSGSLSSPGNPTIRTAASDDEIRSFVTIFRRLYMTGDQDPASLVKVVPIFLKAVADHPDGKWVEGTFQGYQHQLNSVPDCRPFVAPGTCTFTTKRLIDVFIYTQYAHQPDARRQRQFEECLAELSGKRDLLTAMFLAQLTRLAHQIGSTGRVIGGWFTDYCNHHGVSPDVLSSLRDHHAGLGTVEKDEDRRARLLEEKTERLADELWQLAGCPNGGSVLYLAQAREQLLNAVAGNAPKGQSRPVQALPVPAIPAPPDR